MPQATSPLSKPFGPRYGTPAAFGASLLLLVGWYLLPLAGLGGGGAAGAEEAFTITKDECQRMMRRELAARPAPDVAYKPGVDVRGKAVVPAGGDTRPTIEPPAAITFPLTLDMAAKYGIRGGAPFGGDATLGQVTYRDGQVLWNDRPLDGPDATAIRAACEQAYGAR